MSLSTTDTPLNLSSKIEDVYEDVQSESIMKLKNLISSIENGNNSSLSKDISEYSSSDVDNMRRQMNRMHAKQTRLKKKNMTKEMEVVRNFVYIRMYFNLIKTNRITRQFTCYESL
jgi:hypothetical protein